jgi:hypothetical protein
MQYLTFRMPKKNQDDNEEEKEEEGPKKKKRGILANSFFKFKSNLYSMYYKSISTLSPLAPAASIETFHWHE